MKKMIVSVFMLGTLAATTYAKDVKNTTATTVAATDDNKTKIDPATLPDAAKATLASDAYKDWKVTTAWVIKADPVYYTVELQKDGKTNSMDFDKDGKAK